MAAAQRSASSVLSGNSSTSIGYELYCMCCLPSACKQTDIGCTPRVCDPSNVRTVSCWLQHTSPIHWHTLGIFSSVLLFVHCACAAELSCCGWAGVFDGRSRFHRVVQAACFRQPVDVGYSVHNALCSLMINLLDGSRRKCAVYTAQLLIESTYIISYLCCSWIGLFDYLFFLVITVMFNIVDNWCFLTK